MLLPFGLAATGVLVPFSQLSPSRQHALCCDPGVSAIKAVGLACKTLCFPLFQVEGQPFLALSVCGGGGHAAAPNSISSQPHMWILEGLGAGWEPAVALSAKTGTNFPFLTQSSQKPLVMAVPPCPLAFPHLTGNHTTQGKECLGVGGRRAALRDPALPLPQTLSQQLSSQQPLPSCTGLRAGVLLLADTAVWSPGRPQAQRQGFS